MAHQAKILLVDDRAENLFALEAILSSLDQELVFARSGEAAVEAAVADEFAVILLDVVMPGMDGFETAGQIKRRGRTPSVPIIFLTAAGAEPELAFRGYAAGAVDYISKPFDPWVLRAKVAVYVDLYLKNRLVCDLAVLLPAIEEAAAGLAGLPAALTPGALTPGALTPGALTPGALTGALSSGALADRLAQLDGAISALRSVLDGLDVSSASGIPGASGLEG